MPTARLLSRETISNQSLTSIVEKSQSKKPPFQDYELRLSSTQIELIPVSKPNQYIKPISPDEGFESDIDTVSIISSDDSFASSILVEDHVLKHRENDSANGSASSDSDTELPPKKRNESYSLSEVLCYTDVKFPKVLVYCIKDTVLVFSFELVEHLQQLYTSFNTLKAVANSRTYHKNLGTKFNLLHRTDQNGVTHIEISREPRLVLPQEKNEKSNIISINTPETEQKPRTQEPKRKEVKSLDDSKVVLQSELKSKSEFFPSKIEENNDDSLKKVWKSAEDLLDTPKRPEIKRKPKGKAPQPPVQEKQNIMKGQFVRVAVDPKRPIEKSKPEEFQTFSTNLQTFTPNWTTVRQPSPLILKTTPKQKIYPKMEYKKPETFRPAPNWTSSVPRLLKKPRSRSETRQPMAYRYIDTTRPQMYTTNSATISNRLFGLSQKLKEFSTNVAHRNFYDERRNSVGEMTYKNENLKSVIKKQDDKKKGNEKKVTFSAYATVQVV